MNELRDYLLNCSIEEFIFSLILASMVIGIKTILSD